MHALSAVYGDALIFARWRKGICPIRGATRVSKNRRRDFTRELYSALCTYSRIRRFVEKERERERVEKISPFKLKNLALMRVLVSMSRLRIRVYFTTIVIHRSGIMRERREGEDEEEEAGDLMGCDFENVQGNRLS